MNEVIHELYNGKVKIRFVESNHAYWLIEKDGKQVKPMKRLSGVTSFTGKVFDKSDALIGWALDLTGDYLMEHQDELRKKKGNMDEILKEAKAASSNQKDRAIEIGKAVHAWIEAHIKNESPDMPDDPSVLQGVNAFIQWMDSVGAKFDWSERVVYSKKYNFVGTADVGLRFTKGDLKGKKLLGDWKVSNGLYSTVRLQTAAYQGAFLEENPKEHFDGRVAIRISSETEEEYIARMEKKWEKKGYTSSIPDFQPVECKFFSEEMFVDDFKQAMNAWELIQWNKVAEKEIRSR